MAGEIFTETFSARSGHNLPAASTVSRAVYTWKRNILLSLRELLAYCQVWIFLWSDKLITSVLSIIFVHILPASKTISWQSSPNILDIFQNDSILLFQGGLENQSPLFFPTSSDVTVREKYLSCFFGVFIIFLWLKIKHFCLNIAAANTLLCILLCWNANHNNIAITDL